MEQSKTSQVEDAKAFCPPKIERRIVREATKSPRITVKELQAFVASWGHQVSKSTIRRHLNTGGKQTVASFLVTHLYLTVHFK